VPQLDFIFLWVSKRKTLGYIVINRCIEIDLRIFGSLWFRLSQHRRTDPTIDGADQPSKWLGWMLDEDRNHKLPKDAQIDLDTPIYNYVPEGFPLTDPEKNKIKLRHVLSMTSGLAGEDHGLIGLSAAARGRGFRNCFGKAANRFGKSQRN